VIVIGLTGSIGMGKSTVARMARRLCVPVYDSDATVHRLYAQGGAAVRPVGAAFAGVVRDGAIDRAALSRHVVGDPAAFRRLERIVHPLVRRAQTEWLRRAMRRRAPVVVLDVPLLFETAGDVLCDLVVVVSAPAFIQRARVMARPGMTAAKLAEILARQMADAEKRRRADYVLDTGRPRGETLRGLMAIIRAARRRTGTHWPMNPRRLGKAIDARNRPRYGDHRTRSRRRPPRR